MDPFPDPAFFFTLPNFFYYNCWIVKETGPPKHAHGAKKNVLVFFSFFSRVFKSSIRVRIPNAEMDPEGHRIRIRIRSISSGMTVPVLNSEKYGKFRDPTT